MNTIEITPKDQIVQDNVIYKGPSKAWKQIANIHEKNQLNVINPLYHTKKECNSNCVNCVMAYELRQRGFDVVAKTRMECNVSRKAEEMWYNAEPKTISFIELLQNEIDFSIDARYFLGVKYSKNSGHALVLEVLHKKGTVIDPQIGQRTDIEKLSMSGILCEITYWRIDHLEITQTGYNACKGRCSCEF